MNKNPLLITFIRNPRLGKVKTRIGKVLGEKAALDIYIALLNRTREVVSKVHEVDHALYYADEIDKDDMWPSSRFQKFTQQGLNVGERMDNAFNEAFKKGYKKVVLTGCDIYDLTPGIINDAFSQLYNTDIVIGPAYDGGYYLIGMKGPDSGLFKGISWSSSSVLKQTLGKIKDSEKSHKLMNKLLDIDEVSDVYNIEELNRIIFSKEKTI